MALSALGIDIDPDELKQKYNEAKDIMPRVASFVTTLDARLSRIEERLGLSNGNASTTDSDSDSNIIRRIGA